MTFAGTGASSMAHVASDAAGDPALDHTHAHKGGASCLTFGMTIKQVVSGGTDGTVVVWNWGERARAFRFAGHTVRWSGAARGRGARGRSTPLAACVAILRGIQGLVGVCMRLECLCCVCRTRWRTWR
jgi:hypothetical protein